jgi:NF-X1-type zinc finger protein NFXL1
VKRGVGVGVLVGVDVGVKVAVKVGVFVGDGVIVGVAVRVGDDVTVAVSVLVGDGVIVGVLVGVKVSVGGALVGIGVAVGCGGVLVGAGVAVACAAGWDVGVAEGSRATWATVGALLGSMVITAVGEGVGVLLGVGVLDGVTVGGIRVLVGAGVRVGDAVLLGVQVAVISAWVASGSVVGSSASAVLVFFSWDELSALLLSVRIMPKVRANARVPITAMATINSLLRSRRRCINQPSSTGARSGGAG